jgi:hypothetical protein
MLQAEPRDRYQSATEALAAWRSIKVKPLEKRTTNVVAVVLPEDIENAITVRRGNTAPQPDQDRTLLWVVVAVVAIAIGIAIGMLV